MKLELLVVLAVAAFIPSLTEGRLVSKCELETTLAQAANQFNLTENILVKGIQLEDVLAKTFLDDDISDDIACFVKSISWMKAMMFPWKCATLQASEYIQCNQTLSSTTSI
ncbi:uncharacterized protein LOC109616119 isoform X2 [Esox lucius]|uniref:uncharacterized protein LOC109616119 isoform X2 n=1 Tax=Esox lucius TaxID=8010 RepID=UPI0014774A77|nr:uncharacterized protein LOC109616119 isoform X2 [Esox lucius]